MEIVRLSGASLADDCFSIDLGSGEITWNVTRLQDACDRGLFGPPAVLPMSIVPPANWSKGYLNRARIDALKTAPALHVPLIAIMAREPDRIMCFCDGQHRLTARQELGLPDFRTYLVPAEDERRYRITMETIR